MIARRVARGASISVLVTNNRRPPRFRVRVWIGVVDQMNSNALHVVFGTGQVRSALLENFADRVVALRAVSGRQLTLGTVAASQRSAEMATS